MGDRLFVAVYFLLEVGGQVVTGMFCVVIEKWEARLLALCSMLLLGMVSFIGSTSTGPRHRAD